MKSMKSLLALLALMVVCSLPARADAVIDEVLVRRQDDTANIRVTVRNPAVKTQTGPITLRLYARPSGATDWTLLRTWTDIQTIPGGEKVSRDYFEQNNEALRAMMAAGQFDVKARLSGPGFRDVQSSSHYPTEQP